MTENTLSNRPLSSGKSWAPKLKLHLASRNGLSVQTRCLSQHHRRTVEPDDQTFRRLLGAGFQRDARATAKLEDPIAWPDVEKIYGPEIPVPVGWPCRHDPAGDSAQRTLGPLELAHECLAKPHPPLTMTASNIITLAFDNILVNIGQITGWKA